MNKDQPPAAFARIASSASVSSDATAASSAFTHPGETPNPESPELLRECDAASTHLKEKLNLLCSALQPVDPRPYVPSSFFRPEAV